MPKAGPVLDHEHGQMPLISRQTLHWEVPGFKSVQVAAYKLEEQTVNKDWIE